MKKLSDYKGEDAIEIVAELFEPFSQILENPEVKEIFKTEKKVVKIAGAVLKTSKKEVEQILLIIDPAPLTAVNVLFRFISFLNDLMEDEQFSDFFTSALQEIATDSGELMGNTEASDK